MQHIISAILCASFIQAKPQNQAHYLSTYSNYMKPLTYFAPSPLYSPNVPSLYPESIASYYDGNRRTPDYSKFNSGPYALYPRANFREPKLLKPEAEPFSLDLDDVTNTQPEDSSSELDFAIENKAEVKEEDSDVSDSTYYEDLELTENFANYLRRRTHVEARSSVNDAAHQYNALLAVLLALAKAIRNACSNVDEVYDQIYATTVETYFKYGIHNAEKVAALMEEYIQRGNSRISKLKKLRADLCDKELYCPPVIESRIKDAPLIYVKELEILEALAHLAKTYYSYLVEFNEAAQKGTVLAYLQTNKDRVKVYVMSVVNAVNHLTDKPVKCDGS
nr:uncharacterized protein LOC110381061 [Helicoverpa armigera]